MRIAYILPSIGSAAPIVVVQLLSTLMAQNGHICEVFYFDHKDNCIQFICPTKRISFYESIDLSKFDIVHSSGIRPDIYVARNRDYFNRTKYITTIHNFFIEDFSSQYNLFIAHVVGRVWMHYVNKFDEVVLLSKFAVKYYSNWLTTKLVYVGNARYIDKNIKVEFPIIKDDYKILGVNAMLSSVKGVDQIIRALPFLPNYKLFIAGDGKVRNELEVLAGNLGVKDRCYFAGYVKDAYRYMEHYDVYVASSRSEGFPLMLLEAAQYKVPTVCSKIPVFEEIFSPEEVAFFELDNIPSLVEAIRNVPDGKKMYKRYINCYTPQKFYERYLEIYTN